MSWFHKRSSKYYLTVRTQTNGKAARKSIDLGSDFTKAKEKQASIELALKNNKFKSEVISVLGLDSGKSGEGSGNGESITWGEAKEKLIKHLHEIGKAPRTVAILQCSLNEFEAIVKPKTLKDLTASNIDLFIEKRVQSTWHRKNGTNKKVQKSTVSIECRSLRAAFKKLVRWGCIAKNPFLEAEIPVAEKTLPKALDGKSLKKLLAAANKPLRRCIKLIVMSGLRLSEFLNMTYADVNKANATVHVRAHGTKTTKTHSERMVPVEREFVKELGKIGHQDEAIAGRNEMGFPANVNWLERSFKRACNRAGLTGYTIHNLRDTYATLLAANGYYPHEIAARLGHTNIQTAMKYIELSKLLFRKTERRIKYGF